VNSLRNIWAVATRELRSYFLSPLAYVVIFLFLALAGLLFALILNNSREASLRPLLSNVSVLFLFIIPAISMRLVSEELRTGTVELLLTNPVQEWEIVTGKFLASVLLLLVMLALTLLYPIFLVIFGNPDRGPIMTGYLGVFLQGASFLAVGLWASSLTQNQIIAAIVAFGILLVLWLSDNLGQFLGGTFGTIVSYTSATNHFQQFPEGVINSPDVVYYLTLVVAGLVLSTLALQARRLT
jgi:ABC-2 type transport system permease protein